jgi:hypothetical protein
VTGYLNSVPLQSDLAMHLDAASPVQVADTRANGKDPLLPRTANTPAVIPVIFVNTPILRVASTDMYRTMIFGY